MTEAPRYEHDCEHCHYLGHYLQYDLYCCDGFYRTFICRESSEPSDYHSMPETVAIEAQGDYEILNATRECMRRGAAIRKPFKMRVREGLDKMGIRKTRYSEDSRTERYKLAVAHAAQILDSLIFFCTLGAYTSNFYREIVFSDWWEKDL